MNPIVLLVGAPAVGKSTTSRALAARFPKSIHIPVDDIRNMVVSGLALPGPVWGEELSQQVSLARASVVHMALAYHSAGFTVIIDDFWNPGYPANYEALLSHPQVHKFLLYPGQHKAHQRNFQRSGESPARAFIDEGIQLVYQQLDPVVPQLAQEGWVVVDTTALSLEATVTTILRLTAIEP